MYCSLIALVYGTLHPMLVYCDLSLMYGGSPMVARKTKKTKRTTSKIKKTSKAARKTSKKAASSKARKRTTPSEVSTPAPRLREGAFSAAAYPENFHALYDRGFRSARGLALPAEPTITPQ